MPRVKASDFFDDPDQKAVKDFDPEDEAPVQDESEASSEEDKPQHDARQHYEKVGKSKLRQRALATLGPRYQGARVSRTDAEEEENEHDPFALHDNVDGDETDEGEDEDENEDENEMFDDAQDDDSEGQEEEEEEEEDDEDDEEGDDEQQKEDTDDTSVTSERVPKRDRAELANLFNSSKSVTATLAAATASDAAKGRAVKHQRKAFDSLLNVRIRLQHALISTNSMEALPSRTPLEDEKVYEGAEVAAINLFNSLSDLRSIIPLQKTGEKRKRATFDSSSGSDSLWAHLKAQDEQSSSYQRSILQKWSKKTQTSTAEAPSNANRLNPTAQTTLLDVLDSHLSAASLPRLVAKTRLPRSCAPLQQLRPRKQDTQQNGTHEDEGKSKPAEDEDKERIYDDADFYGILLKELLEARSANADADYSIAATNAANGNVENEYKAARQAKTHSRPDVDRKASKGRKMKYTVHEKLQNFMAPEDRGVWEARQRDDLFGSLFGKHNALQEDVDAEEDDGLAEEDALLLFRS